MRHSENRDSTPGDPVIKWPYLQTLGTEMIMFGRSGIHCAFERICDVTHLLFAAEREVLGRVVPQRVTEFAAGRHCARAALAQFEVAAVPLLIGHGGVPQLPPGFIGSISHGAGYAGAAVAQAGHYATVGLDIERRGGVTPELYSLLFTEVERVRLIDADLATLLFSAKEAIYKAAFPLLYRWIDFLEVSIFVDFARSAFAMRPVRSDGDLTPFEEGVGAFSVQDDVVLTLFWLPGNKTT